MSGPIISCAAGIMNVSCERKPALDCGLLISWALILAVVAGFALPPNDAAAEATAAATTADALVLEDEPPLPVCVFCIFALL